MFPLIPFYIYIPLQALCISKTFIIFHDLTHGSFFPSKKYNKYFCFPLSALTWVPVTWGKSHYYHHQTSGNRDRMGFNETILLTVKQFHDLPKTKKYFLSAFHYFWPIKLGLTFIYLWFYYYRIACFVPNFNEGPTNKKQRNQDRFHSKSATLISNIAVLIILLSCYHIGGFHFVWSYIVALFLGHFINLYGFHLQHNFNPPYIKSADEWTNSESALLGSSRLIVQRWMNWFTLGIEYHHIHHLAPFIPGYNLRTCFEQAPSCFWDGVHTVSWHNPQNRINLALYDEEKNLYVTITQALAATGVD